MNGKTKWQCFQGEASHWFTVQCRKQQIYMLLSYKISKLCACRTCLMIVFTLYAIALNCLTESEAISLWRDKMADVNENMNSATAEAALSRRQQRVSAFGVAEGKRGAWEREAICRKICGFCGRYMARRVSALCSDECLWNGDSYRACFTLWSIAHYNARSR